MRTCEICGRPIRTGRKYCWEHRHTSQAEAIRGDRLFNEATERYWKQTKIKYFAMALLVLFIATFFPIGVFGVLMVYILIIIFVCFWLMLNRNKILHSERCEEYVKNYLRKHQQEQERRNRIKDEALYR